ncbi:MAG TPA: Rne/Rng family ribonuclease [Pseudolysinimonas sp.]
MVKSTRSENSKSDDAANAGDPVEKPKRAPRKRVTAAKSAAEHVNAGVEVAFDPAPDVAADARAKATRGGRKKAVVGEDAAASTPSAEAKSGRGSIAPLLFQAPDLPTPSPETMSRAAKNSRGGAGGAGGGATASTSDDETGGTTRRRSRRRSGDAPREGDDAPNTTVRVRQPRQQQEPKLITEPQRVKGSTRLEAKKQRRRDGRDAGRRRPVVTEAEFLARRESVDRVMVVRSKFGRIQIGVLEDGVLVEHYVARAADASLIGNVYLGRVQNVLPSMEAAFVDIGRGRNAVLYSGEVDWEAAAAAADEAGRDGKNQARRIELALKPGDRVLVQVTKDPVGHKGARLTSQVSLPGRYLVYVPNGSMNGISRKLPDTERARLKKILKEVLPDDAGVIVRTAAEGATEEQLTLDVQRLTSQWAEIEHAVETQQAPALLHSEPDLLIKIVRDVFNEDFQKLVIEGDDALDTISSYVGAVAPDLVDRIEKYDSAVDSFDQYRVSEQIEKALERKVWLPSGGSLIVDRTEAMTVIDVNTGKFVGTGGNLEETVTKNNLEAAEEIVRQLRLRDIGGIIVVDFIDMVLESNRDLVLRRVVECLSRDRTKHQVAEVTSLGLVQMTRKKLGLGLVESFSENCEVCAGRGIIIHHDPVFKHRTPEPIGSSTGSQTGPSSSRGRRGRGGSGGGQSSQGSVKNGVGSTGTHAITEDVRNALAQIAKSTVPHTDHEHESGDAVSSASAESALSRAEQAVEAAAEAAVEILDIPVPVAKGSRSSRRISTQDAEQILGSVLGALPEPKQPGQGRVRASRRASSAGAVVTPPDTAE